MQKQYSPLKALAKVLLNAVIFFGPTLVGLLPTDVANMTLSGGIYLLINFLKVKYM